MRDDNLLLMQIDNMIDMEYPLVGVAGPVGWSAFGQGYAGFYPQRRTTLPMGLIGGCI